MRGGEGRGNGGMGKGGGKGQVGERLGCWGDRRPGRGLQSCCSNCN